MSNLSKLYASFNSNFLMTASGDLTVSRYINIEQFACQYLLTVEFRKVLSDIINKCACSR